MSLPGVSGIPDRDKIRLVELYDRGELRFYEGVRSDGYAVRVRAPESLSGDVDLVLPGADGSAGQFLTTDGAGQLAFASPGASQSPKGATFTPLVAEIEKDLVGEEEEGWKCLLWEVPAGAVDLWVAARITENMIPEGAWSMGLYSKNIPGAEDPFNSSEVEQATQLFGGINELTTGVAGTTVNPSKYSSDLLFSTVGHHRAIPFGGWIVLENLSGSEDELSDGKIRLTVFYSLITAPTS